MTSRSFVKREIDSHGWHLANSFVRAEHIILQFAYRFPSTSITNNETYWHFLNLLFAFFFILSFIKECRKAESLILHSPGGKKEWKERIVSELPCLSVFDKKITSIYIFYEVSGSEKEERKTQSNISYFITHTIFLFG